MNSVKQALTIIGGMSAPSKMPTFAYSTPASECNTGSKLREVEGSTCFTCYAHAGRYRMHGVQNALSRRLNVIQAALAPGGNYDEVVNAFVFLIQKREAHTRSRLDRAGIPEAKATAWIAENGGGDHRFFRWHDSGDLISPRHLAMICEIAERCPTVTFWIPTREYGIVRTFLRAGGTIPSNLTLRLSAHMVDGKPPSMGLPTSTVSSDGKPGEGSCPAPVQGGECKACRACWTRPGNVDYLIH